MSVILEAKGVVKTYQTGNVETPAIRGIDLALEQGKFYALVGKSGCGKSTLLHMLGGLERPTEGEILLRGQNLYEGKERQRTILRRSSIGFIFQAYNLVYECTVHRNILLPLAFSGKRPEPELLDEIISALGIGNLLKKYPHELSGGEQQRVAIARCLITKVPLILADEPTGNLDHETGVVVMKLLRELSARYKQTIVMVTHDVELAETADNIVRIQDGQVV